MIYMLESENLTRGPMGTERTSTNWKKFFKSIGDAKNYAEKDYGKEIDWSRKHSPTCDGKPIDITCSGDLGYVMYHVTRVKVE